MIVQEAVQQAFNSLRGQATNLTGNAAQLNDLANQLQYVFEHATKALDDCADDLRTMGSMATDYANGRYKEVPLNTIIAIVIAILYVVSPIDLIPDKTPGIGYVDDAAVVAFALSQVHEDVDRYREWKQQQ